MGKQDYWLGAPIWPEELEKLPYGERKRRVIDAINGLGPLNTEEQPGVADPAFAAAARDWSGARGVDLEQAVLRQVLADSAEVCEETRSLLETEDWTTLEGDWLQAFGRRLLGEKP
jgi:hypothetical protein